MVDKSNVDRCLTNNSKTTGHKVSMQTLPVAKRISQNKNGKHF